jgi:predicted methyltransferase
VRRDTVACSLDLGRTGSSVSVDQAGWRFEGQAFPWIPDIRERTVYHWTGQAFEPAARFSGSLVKLVPTEWGPPTFEIDGIKMLPTAELSPWEDARRMVELIRPRGSVILDTCGGLGYFAAWCLAGDARQVISFEKNPDVIWLRGINPWSPGADSRLALERADVTERIGTLPAASVDAALHDPPRFGMAGELYSLAFYEQLARVIKPRGRLFHYTGSPNRLGSGRDVAAEVARRLGHAGFRTKRIGDGVLATRATRG